MNEIRNELDKVMLKIYRLKDLSELLEDYFCTEICKVEYSKGDTLAALIAEKIKEIDNDLENVYKTTTK